MEVGIIPVSEAQICVVQNLFCLYAHDLSEYGGWDLMDDGRFATPITLSQYWQRSPGSVWPDDWRGFPFLLRVGGQLAGFALIKQVGAQAFDMGEFFIVRKYRHQGVGQSVAHALFDRFKGTWEVRQLPENMPAQRFWRRVIAEYTHNDFREALEHFAVYGREFTVQRFASAPRVERPMTENDTRTPRAVAREIDGGQMNIERYASGPRMSQAVGFGDLVFLSGQVANDPSGDFAKQTSEVLANLDRVLASAASAKANILSATVYLIDAGSFKEFNSHWERWLQPAHTPARTTVVSQLAAPGYLIEIQLIAARSRV